MGSKYDIELMVSVSRMYYDERLKQDEIARKLNVSRSSISLILADAREYGIVEIRVRDPHDNNVELSDAFCRLFGLSRCYVVPTSVTDPELLLKLTVRKAVDVFNDIVSSGELVGLSWGRTCYQFMSDYSAAGFFEKVKVVPMTGGTLLNARPYQLNELVRQFSDKLGGDPVFFHAPAFPQTADDYSLYMQSGEVRTALELWEKIDTAVITFGAPPATGPDNVVAHMSLSDEEYEFLRNNAAGDICARYYDIDGRFLSTEPDGRIIGISPEILKKTGHCIAVVSGRNKLASTIGGLRTGIADILIIDESTAAGVLNLLEEE